jgi:ketosteroid isomerase-like protein
MRGTVTEARIDTLRRAYEAFNRRDIDAVLAHLDPDVKWPNVLEGKVLHGHDAVRDYWTAQWESIDPHVDPIDFVEAGEWLVVRVDQVVADKQGQVVARDTVVHAHLFTPGGAVREMVVFPSVEEATVEVGAGSQ